MYAEIVFRITLGVSLVAMLVIWKVCEVQARRTIEKDLAEDRDIEIKGYPVMCVTGYFTFSGS